MRRLVRLTGGNVRGALIGIRTSDTPEIKLANYNSLSEFTF